MTAISFPSQPLIEKFKDLKIVINSPESELTARNHLTDVRLALKRLTADIKSLKQPHQDFIKSIDEAATPWKNILAERDQDLEKALLTYGRQVREAAEIAQRKLMEQYEKKVERLEAKAEAQGKPMPIVLPPPIIATPPKSVATDSGKQTVVKRKAWRLRLAGAEVADPSVVTAKTSEEFKAGIPLEYFILDTARIGKVVRAGGSIPGIELYEEESISVRG